MNREFIAWASPVGILGVDHTSVESINPNGHFGCFGGKNKHKWLFTVAAGPQSFNRAESCKSTWDSFTINYAVDGVCHQATNRALLFVNSSICQQRKYPRGYNASHTNYGTYGLSPNYSTWYTNKYLPSLKKFPDPKSTIMDPQSLTGQILQLYQSVEKNNMDRNDLIVKDSALLLSAEIDGYQGEPFALKQLDILHTRSELFEQYGLGVQDFEEGSPKLSSEDIKAVFTKANTLGKEMQIALKETIGTNTYKDYIDSEDVLYDVIDLSIALEVYKK